MKPTWNPAQRPLPASGLVDMAADLLRVNSNPALPMASYDLRELDMYLVLAYENLARGSASAESFEYIVFAMNLALLLAEMGYGEDWIPQLRAALDGAFRGNLRGDAHGSYRLDGPAIAAIDHAIDLHRAQLEVASREDIRAACATMRERIAEGNVYAVEPAES